MLAAVRPPARSFLAAPVMLAVVRPPARGVLAAPRPAALTVLASGCPTARSRLPCIRTAKVTTLTATTNKMLVSVVAENGHQPNAIHYRAGLGIAL